MIDFKLWDGDEVELSRFNQLLNLIHKSRNVDYETFKWKHLDNPVARSIIAFAFADGEMVGGRALQPTLHSDALIYQPCDTVTHPDYQRRGVFGSLTELALKQVDGDDYVILNFPNNSSLPAYLKQGWKFYKRLVPRLGFNPLFYKNSLTPVDQDDATAEFSRIESELLKDYCIWRFCKCPSRSYTFLKRTDESIIIVNDRKMVYEVFFNVKTEAQRPITIPFLHFGYVLHGNNNVIEKIISKVTGKGAHLVAHRDLRTSALNRGHPVNISGIMDTF